MLRRGLIFGILFLSACQQYEYEELNTSDESLPDTVINVELIHEVDHTLEVVDSVIRVKEEKRRFAEREYNSLKLENSKVKAAVSITEKTTEEKDSLLGCLQAELKLAEEAYQKSLDDHKKVVKMYQFELKSQEDEISHLKNINKELLLELQVLENRLTEVDSVILESKNIRQIKRSVLE